MSPARMRSDQIPLESALADSLAWFIRLRWWAAAGILAGTWVGVGSGLIQLETLPLVALGLTVGAYNAAFVYLFYRLVAAGDGGGAFLRFIYVQIGVDWISLFFLVYYTGGVRSPVALAFTFHVVLGALLLSRRACYQQAACACLLAGLLAALESGAGDGVLLRRWLSLSLFWFVTALLTSAFAVSLRRKEAALLDSQRALGKAYGDLKKLHDERVWFARMTHHQLRAPLAALDGMLDAVALAGPLAERQRDLVGRARRRVGQALELIRDLLDLASAQRPLADTAVPQAELPACLQEVVATAAEQAQLKGIRFDVDLGTEGVWVEGAAEDLQRVFSNLLDNAVKYTPEGGRVGFSLSVDSGEVRLEVADSGIGIAAEDQGRVFEGFYRTREAKASGALGTGLGLSIVVQLVRRWGGEVQLHSAPGQGARFGVTLQRHTLRRPHP